MTLQKSGLFIAILAVYHRKRQSVVRSSIVYMAMLIQETLVPIFLKRHNILVPDGFK